MLLLLECRWQTTHPVFLLPQLVLLVLLLPLVAPKSRPVVAVVQHVACAAAALAGMHTMCQRQHF
jgi:hypothetical protein